MSPESRLLHSDDSSGYRTLVPRDTSMKGMVKPSLAAFALFRHSPFIPAQDETYGGVAEIARALIGKTAEHSKSWWREARRRPLRSSPSVSVTPAILKRPWPLARMLRTRPYRRCSGARHSAASRVCTPAPRGLRSVSAQLGYPAQRVVEASS